MRGGPRWWKISKNKVIHQPNNTAAIVNIINTAKKLSSQNRLLRLCYCLISERGVIAIGGGSGSYGDEPEWEASQGGVKWARKRTYANQTTLQ